MAGRETSKVALPLESGRSIAASLARNKRAGPADPARAHFAAMPETSPDPHLKRDILHSLAVSALACVATGGLLYLAYLIHTLRVAMRAPHASQSAELVLVFGKRLQQGQPDADFLMRLQHAHRLAQEQPARTLVLLGGRTDPGLSEAEAGLALLQTWGLPERARVLLEDQSQDTLQNLRHARELLGESAGRRVLLLSNRYHLARCAQLARQLGFDHALCAAEPTLKLDARLAGRLCTEAAYLCWLDIGTRWARLIGHRRMLERVS